MARAWASTALVALALGGCGDDAAHTAGTGGGGAGGSLAAGGGAGVAGPTDAATTSTEDGGSPRAWPSAEPPPMSVMCAGAPCEGSGGLTPCCTNDDACGAMYMGRAGAGCVIVNAPGLIDPACPQTDEGSGCCREDGLCGAFYSPTFGCIDPEAFPTSTPPERIPCTRTP